MTPSTVPGAARPSAAWIAVALLLVYFLFFGGAAIFQSSPQARVLTHVMLVLIGVVTIAGAARARIDLRTPLAAPALAWVLANILATISSSRPDASREALALLLLALPTYPLVRHLVWDRSLRSRVEWLLIVAAAVFVVAWLTQVLLQWLTWWSAVGIAMPPLRPGDVGLTVGTVNGVALYLELLVPISVWLSWRRWRSAPFSIGLAVLATFAFLVTGSRGAWVGGFAGAALLAFLIARDRRGVAITEAARRLPVVVRAGALVAITVAVAVAGPALMTRIAAGDAGRLELWSAAWGIFVEHPVLGGGPGSWQGLRAAGQITDGNLAVLFNAHDSPLQALAETGLVGLAAGAWLVTTIGRLAWRSLRGSLDLAERRIRSIAVASLAAAAVHSLFDTQFHLPGVVLLVFVLVAHLDPPPERRSRQPVPTGIATVSLLAGVLLLAPVDAAMVRAEVGNRSLDRGDAAAALTEYEAAVALHDLPVYRLGEAIARSRLDDIGGARRALERVVDREPFTFVTASRSWAALEDGDAAAARALADEVVAAGSYDPTAAVVAAAVRSRTGDPTGAVPPLAAAMVLVPSLIYSTPPQGLFEDAAWEDAAQRALAELRQVRPVSAAVAATRARREDAATYRAAVPAGPESELLTLLDQAVVTGTTDLGRAREILRATPASQGVLDAYWALAFELKSQEDIDLATRVAFPQFAGLPQAPHEIVLGGNPSASWSMRLPRYPMAASGRLGPNRPYLAGMPTIEPVFRPDR